MPDLENHGIPDTSNTVFFRFLRFLSKSGEWGRQPTVRASEPYLKRAKKAIQGPGGLRGLKNPHPLSTPRVQKTVVSAGTVEVPPGQWFPPEVNYVKNLTVLVKMDFRRTGLVVGNSDPKPDKSDKIDILGFILVVGYSCRPDY